MIRQSNPLRRWLSRRLLVPRDACAVGKPVRHRPGSAPSARTHPPVTALGSSQSRFTYPAIGFGEQFGWRGAGGGPNRSCRNAAKFLDGGLTQCAPTGIAVEAGCPRLALVSPGRDYAHRALLDRRVAGVTVTATSNRRDMES